ncbi:NADH-quinone oxidoreductase subunit K [Candidatus Desantisbacteria bacterium CG2_30_40_21]|uniref:NADH-quinone oxidoreductase subunit K n=5 Tax=unclassified Candidatus Desantisiibacteriota TaxID=3106372 RepID=A0A2M7JEX4_9BACT|nr:MAG: NADH-quinone oxidoreductase subunit K [Candidatus Desantisbacteria bacterium CG2_30_40_21]PIP40784.1 MAG: NADH-quinone oxidoreductase subunit NuoK [Candidatus Desantisbacteria bacterium CG23_combo_of_CG06-09_8_20_14_all_40_23]PIX17937.1 MAG: NADH-quinone oxidoreductase subunit NuoK [Candidatus Desantisbacteria bacterium CG_4_8_14_3_um_filter_40_12]PIY19909.1 MAG: NADH-quinone oxidoreductase subunit NuoK [Candidatus Desantisbacteria bacterium CG_4_10_14_3_um_filter_40_18]PJB29862.1 MAG: 
MCLTNYLILSAIFFCLGIYGVLVRRNAVMILLSIELMLNAANINFVAFAKYMYPHMLTGHIFTMFVIAIEAAEVAVALAIILSAYRHMKSINVEDINLMKW